TIRYDAGETDLPLAVENGEAQRALERLGNGGRRNPLRPIGRRQELGDHRKIELGRITGDGEGVAAPVHIPGIPRAGTASRSELRAVGGDDTERVTAVAAVARWRRNQRDLVADLDHAFAPTVAVVVVAAVTFVLDVARALSIGHLEHDLRVRVGYREFLHD